MNKNDRILITGGSGMLGHALQRVLSEQGYWNVFPVGRTAGDLKNTFDAESIFEYYSPDYVFHLAAQIHGGGGNVKYKADVLYNNAMINMNVINFSREAKVKKIVAVGSGCIYPDFGKGLGLTEDQIWSGEPHESEDAYAHTKRFMLAQLKANKEQYDMPFAYAICGNMYGEYDNFDIQNGHVIPGLIAKFYKAVQKKSFVSAWGSGIAIRDFSYGYDSARALYLLMQECEGPINIGSGFVHPISDVVNILKDITKIEVLYDRSKSNGQLERYYSLNKLNDLGFKAEVDLESGIRRTYDWYTAYIRRMKNG